MCYFNRLTRVARWLADYPEWLQFCWDFVKHPRNDEIALQHFFFLAYGTRIFFISFVLHVIFFFQQALAGIFFQNHRPPPPSPTQWSAPKFCLFGKRKERIQHLKLKWVSCQWLKLGSVYTTRFCTVLSENNNDFKLSWAFFFSAIELVLF